MMKVSIPLWALVPALLFFHVQTHASELSEPSPTIEHIRVDGSRLAIPAEHLAISRTVLSEDEIRASGALQLTDLLRGLPGVSIAQSGSPGALTEIRLRGSESNHLLVLIDGVVANDIGQGSLLDLAHLTTANIVRVELLRGPQSALWGSGALGGVLSITTRAATQTFSAHIGAGSDQTTQAGLNGSGQFHDVSVRGYVEAFETGGDNVARQGDEADGYKNITAGFALDGAFASVHQLSWTVRTTHYDNDYDSTDAVTGLPVDANNTTTGEQVSSRLRWRYQPDNSHYVSILSGHYHSDVSDNRVEQTDDGGTRGRRQQLTWLNQYRLENWSLAAGLDYLRRDYRQRGPIGFGDPNQTRHDTTTAALLEVAGAIAPDWHTSLSLRYDDNSEFDNAISYRGGLTWDVSSAFTAFVSHGQAVKTPTFTERFGYFPGMFIGNPDLQVETSREWEAGLRADYGNTAFTASAFDTRLHNEILGYVFEPTLGGATARNASADSRRRGLESSFDVTSGNTRLRASYTYLDASEQSGGNQLSELRRARHQGAVSLNTPLGSDAVSLYLKLAYTGSREDLYFPAFPQPAERVGLRPYTLASVNVRYQLAPRWQLALRVDNAFDADYEDIVGFTGEQRRALLTLHYEQ